MDRKIIFGEISELLEIIAEQTETIARFEGQIPQIEIDILLSNIRNLYEKYKELDCNSKPQQQDKMTENQPADATDKKIVPSKIAEPTEKEIIEFEKTMLVESMAQYSMLSENEDKKTDTEQEIVFPPTKIKPQKKSSPDLFSADNTVVDKSKDDKKSLNEKFCDQVADKSIASKLQKNPIKDLKTAIGINEKFMFINELFEGSLQKYNENINSLNTMKNREEAMKFIDVLKSEYSWKKNSDAYNAFTDLVSRRYS